MKRALILILSLTFGIAQAKGEVSKFWKKFYCDGKDLSKMEKAFIEEFDTNSRDAMSYNLLSIVRDDIAFDEDWRLEKCKAIKKHGIEYYYKVGLEKARLAIKYGANLRASALGYYAINWAHATGKHEIVSLLLEKGAPADTGVLGDGRTFYKVSSLNETSFERSPWLKERVKIGLQILLRQDINPCYTRRVHWRDINVTTYDWQTAAAISNPYFDLNEDDIRNVCKWAKKYNYCEDLDIALETINTCHSYGY